MRCEWPEVTRCCFCFPLRLGLLVWSYIKLVYCTMLFSYLLYGTITMCMLICDESTASLFQINIPILLGIFLEAVFLIVFITSAHKKEYKKMKVYYIYCLVMLGMSISALVAMIIFAFFKGNFDFFVSRLLDLGGVFWIIVIQIYIIILVRSEVQKLMRKMNFEFVNRATEAECTVQVDSNEKELPAIQQFNI